MHDSVVLGIDISFVVTFPKYTCFLNQTVSLISDEEVSLSLFT